MKIESPCEKCLVNPCCTKQDECSLQDRFFYLYYIVKAINDKKVVGIDPILLELYKNGLISISKDIITMNIEKYLDDDHMEKVRSKFLQHELEVKEKNDR